MDNIDVKRDNDLADTMDTFPVHSPSGVLAVSDILRRCLVHFSDNAVAGADVLRRDVEAAATSLSMQHMAMCRELGERSRSFFAAEFLIQCLLSSGRVTQWHGWAWDRPETHKQKNTRERTQNKGSSRERMHDMKDTQLMT